MNQLSYNKIKLGVALFFAIFLLNVPVLAQPCTNPGQTAATAFPVCGSTLFTQTNVPPCAGIATPSPSCSFTNSNPYFYKFTVVTSGTLGFLITPVNMGADYDFQLFNITNAASPNEIYTNGSLFKTGNVSATPGTTGCTANGSNIALCNPGFPFNALQNVTAGQKYLLVVVNFGGGGNGYTLNFTGGTASITEVQPINFTQAAASCSNASVTVKLNRDILCTSIAADGSDFVITPAIPGVNITAAVSASCLAGQFSTDSIKLNLSAPLPPGNYTIAIKNGNDGNTLFGICPEQMTIGENIPFTANPPQAAPQFSQVIPVACAATQVRFQLTKPVQCASIAPNGSDYIITGPSAVNIIAASGICSGTPLQANEIALTLAAPLTVGGQYTLAAKNGTDNNTAVDVCGLQQPITDNIPFTINGVVNAAFTYTIKYGCEKDTVVFNYNGNSGTNFQWDFGDPPAGLQNTSTQQNPVHIYSSFGIKNVRLTVSNGSCSNFSTQQINLDNAIASDYSIAPKDSVCFNNAISFGSNATGFNLNHFWVFGDGQTANVPNPQPINFTRPGNFDVVYTIVNNLGCSVVVTKKVSVLPLPSASYTISKTRVCVDEKIVFTATPTGNVESYLWNFGDGTTNNNTITPAYSYTQQNNYATSFTVKDKFCGSANTQIPIQVYNVPKVDLGNDTTLCTANTVTLTAGTNAAYTYLWNTGQTTQTITYGGATKQIAVNVTNGVCVATASVNVKVLSSCRIYVPTAFTPNKDGKNDVFKVLNADLVKVFNLQIFNRLGQKIFESNNPFIGWDGNVKGVASGSGAYVWMLRVKEAATGESTVLKGSILLLR